MVNDALIADAAERLRGGGLVAMPTETVYGLAADAENGEAVARIFACKQRPSFNPLIVHLPEAAMAGRYAEVTKLAKRLIGAFWPGPLTLVLERSETCPASELVSAGLSTIALRMPDHPVAGALLAAFGHGLAAPSANRSGHISPTSAAHVRQEFHGEDLLVLDGGASPVGIESTVVDARGEYPVLLRPGSITEAQLIEVAGGVRRKSRVVSGDGSPGALESHYAPRQLVRLNAADIRPGEALLAFGPNAPGGAKHMFNLSEGGRLEEAASRLFAGLRALEASDCETIAVMPVPGDGVGAAINDRLRRAAAPRTSLRTLFDLPEAAAIEGDHD